MAPIRRALDLNQMPGGWINYDLVAVKGQCMPIKDILAVARAMGARITAVAVEQDISGRPQVTIPTGPDNTAAAGEVRNLSNAHGLLQAFDAAANSFGVRNELPDRVTRPD